MYYRRVDFMHNVLPVAVRLGLEAIVWRCPEEYVLLYDEKSLEKFQQIGLFFIKGACYRPAILIKMNLFAGIFQ